FCYMIFHACTECGLVQYVFFKFSCYDQMIAKTIHGSQPNDGGHFFSVKIGNRCACRIKNMSANMPVVAHPYKGGNFTAGREQTAVNGPELHVMQIQLYTQ